ncbi:acetate--CoA ligase [Paraglaciecola psychrophila]|jgi:acetyl-CoA synthetase|uniref:Acetyl-coenzyme A synthetase n=1 Tax=Paraglaciecola psychrophila 170 TaxID=1129794 RepID=K7A5I1_9ALTE|nr:acetate--CoA ligase [Paraglaciecola psychrophila]AGH42459.1 acetate--CoA ligase [Paraglaciecola psychrophila 170]GAC37612.1 acetyl-CoA synthetase [Paraglaciecola psychrophila 170]
MTKMLYPVPEQAKQDSFLSVEKYQIMYQQSVESPDEFWREQSSIVDWYKAPTIIKNTNFSKDNLYIKWFEDGLLNVSYNCIDRHLAKQAQQTAIIWEGDSPETDQNISYQQLHDEVCRLANGLKNLGIAKGDRVAIYMPMVPEAAYAMLACTRIGAVHSIVFAGFSPNAIADRINDCDAKVVITADEGRRGGKTVPLKLNVDEALKNNRCPSIKHNIVFQNTYAEVAFNPQDLWWHELVADCTTECTPTEMNAEDPLFILYTSGSTGTPKGVVHTTGGYLVYAALTHKYVFDYHPGEIYWCAADVGWITGHSYMVYGPLANGATTLLFEGVPTYPDVRRICQIVDKHKVNILYTAPTAIRALMAHGDYPADGTHCNSLRLLGSVGEPINPQAWQWYYETIGKSRCPIVDTWWQTETGGIMITPLPSVTALKPGAASMPFFGIQPAVVDKNGEELLLAAEGNLVIRDSWPGQGRTVYGDHQRFIQTYFSTYENQYFTGDGCRRDDDGYYWITGRVDDVLNVSGHRLGTAEIESALVSHPAVAEAAVVGYSHDIKGQGIYVFVSPVEGQSFNDELTIELKNWVRKELSPIATPDIIQWTQDLPKTRSGKIMRRILRKIAANEYEQLGDISTLADPSVVESLIANRLNR